MSRKGTQDRNDIPLIIGTLPKRLQNKIAASCSSAAEAEDVENAEPEPATIQRQITILSKSSAKCSNVAKTPVLDTSGSENRPKDVNCIPGILRLSAIEQVSDNRKGGTSAGRRRARTHPARMHERTRDQQKALSPLSCVRLTTDHPLWFDQLLEMPDGRNIIQLYDQLMVLQHRNLILINWKNFCYLHDQLQDAFTRLLLEHLKFVCEHKVDAFFWKFLFYNVREYLKRQHTEVAKSHILLLIDQAVKFYRILYDKIMAKYISSRCESAVKVVAQRLLICLGDLTRYRACYLQNTDYVEASKYYLRAQELVPGNGAPYNQLAIIAIYHHKRFDAVYYYMRSLLTSNAIQTAKESLLDVFDEIRRKYEETEMKQSPQHRPATPKKSKQMRKEVWIYPDGVRRLHRTDVKSKLKNKATVAELNRYEDMAPDELLPRALSIYLYLIGKLYTGIDVECMYQQLRKLQIQFTAVLKHDNLLTRSKLLKMAALNIFVIEHNKRKASCREMRYHSFNFANSIFGLILSKANQLFTAFPEEQTDPQHFGNIKYAPLNTYLQFIKVYVQWLAINVDIWEPVRTEEHSFIDCWSELQTLFDNIESIRNKFGENELRSVMPVILDEDIALNGFDPLGRDTGSKECGPRDSESTQFLERIRKIAQFQECYQKHQDSLQQPLNSSFTIEDLNTAMEVALSDFGAEDCARVVGTATDNKGGNTIVKEQYESSSSGDSDVSQLCKLKKELEAKAKVKQICNSKLEEILKFVDTKLYIEVRPRYLLPDTNCFIDCLEDIEKLSLEYKRYTVIIPLTVVKELDGLSKGVKLESYHNSKQMQRIHHFDEVSTRAKKSLEFIKSAKNNVKCATTKGSIINASLFALVEEEYASNDDKILATAVAVSKTASSEQCQDGKCFIQTELVLITTDRNLRVKALSRNLAVSTLDEFIQWAKDCRDTT
ncbi:telomerase-binding protein EST1A [Scaptodrosophila lebanonensis]|uniref:Telomerase-binding protein EST1A n=1 Tax=Drosophila lebanonensis TaxID=7225 RepID=A0A6J2T6H0_DROLE|nr:telomerase-binding protein EST1A [Scaptodrosophila lebanonensis]